MRQRILLAGPDMKLLAEKIAAERPEEIRLGALRWDRFPNRQWDLEVLEDVDLLRQSSVSLLMGFTNQENHSAQFDMLDELVSMGLGRLQLLMPFHSTATSERKFKRGSVASAVAFGRRLTSVVGAERCNLYIYDVHAPAVMGMFGSGIKVIDRTATTLLKQWVDEQGLTDQIVFAFPDRGAKKRFEDMFNGNAKDGRKYTTVACDKIRDGNKRIVTLCPGDEKKVVGKIVIVVDDLIRSGETLLKCVEAILEAGALKAGVYGTHADFESGTKQRFMEAKNVAWALITDSCPETAARAEDDGQFTVLTLAKKLARDVCNDLTITERAMLQTAA